MKWEIGKERGGGETEEKGGRGCRERRISGRWRGGRRGRMK